MRPDRGASKSISGERTFGRDVSDRGRLLEEVTALGVRVAARLRRHGLVARTVHLKARYPDFATVTRAGSMAGSIAEIRKRSAEAAM